MDLLDGGAGTWLTVGDTVGGRGALGISDSDSQGHVKSSLFCVQSMSTYSNPTMRTRARRISLCAHTTSLILPSQNRRSCTRLVSTPPPPSLAGIPLALQCATSNLARKTHRDGTHLDALVCRPDTRRGLSWHRASVKTRLQLAEHIRGWGVFAPSCLTTHANLRFIFARETASRCRRRVSLATRGAKSS